MYFLGSGFSTEKDFKQTNKKYISQYIVTWNTAIVFGVNALKC